MTIRKGDSDGDMHGRVRCSRCGCVMQALAFNVHKCADRRDLDELPTDLLYGLARNQISETEAWRLFDARRGEQG